MVTWIHLFSLNWIHLFLYGFTSCTNSLILVWSSEFTCSHLQFDLDSLYFWNPSNVTFDQEKAVFLRFQAGPCPISAKYFLDNQELLLTNCHRDLGVIISNDFSWSAHYNKIVSKAYRTLGLICRSFGSSTNVQTRKLLYISLVRSQLTYCSTIWRPQLLKMFPSWNLSNDAQQSEH